MHRTVRLLAGSVVLASLAAALTGCAGGPGNVAGCTPKAESGQASQSISASGKFGSAPTVQFDTPIHVDDTQVSTLIAGTGAPLTSKQEVSADVTFLNATTGAEVT